MTLHVINSNRCEKTLKMMNDESFSFKGTKIIYAFKYTGANISSNTY